MKKLFLFLFLIYNVNISSNNYIQKFDKLPFDAKVFILTFLGNMALYKSIKHLGFDRNEKSTAEFLGTFAVDAYSYNLALSNAPKSFIERITRSALAGGLGSLFGKKLGQMDWFGPRNIQNDQVAVAGNRN